MGKVVKMKDKPKSIKNIRKGDKVIGIAGNCRGYTGTVLKIDGQRVVVQGLNLCKKHVKPTQANQKGNIISIERPIHVSNLRLCLDDNKPLKLRTRFNDQGQRELFYKVDDQEMLYRSLKN